MKPLPLAIAAAITVLIVGAVIDLVFLRSRGLSTGIVEAITSVCSCSGPALVWLLSRSRQRIPASATSQLSILPVEVPTGRIPDKVRDRKEQFAYLGRYLRKPSGHFVVLAGMGGVGKSTIASSFGHHVGQTKGWRHVDVWHVSAVNSASLTGALATIASRLEGTPNDVEAIATGKVDGPDRLWRLLQAARHRWLLILDNADDPEVLARPVATTVGQGFPETDKTGTPTDGTGWIRPAKRGLIVVTSRNRDEFFWGTNAHVLPVDPLNEEDASQVLLDQAPGAGDKSQARALARRLGGVPLSLRIAGSYLNAPSASMGSFHDYQEALLLTPNPELRADVPDRQVPIRTYELSLNHLSQKGLPQARALLRLLSCYAAQTPIPREFLKAKLLQPLLVPDGLGPSGTDADAHHMLEQVLRELGNLSLIEFRQTKSAERAGGHDLVLHSVIASTAREHLRTDKDQGKATRIWGLAVELVAAASDQLDVERPSDWPSYSSHGPHIRALLKTADTYADVSHYRILLTVATMTAQAYFNSGFIFEAKRLANAVLSRLSILSGDDPESVGTRHHLAWFLVILQQPRLAEEIYNEVLRIRTNQLGFDAPETLWTRHEMAWLMACDQRWNEAEKSYRLVLQVRQRTLGDENPDVLMTRHELGWAIGNQGRVQEAEQLLSGVLTVRQKVLGDENPRTLWTRHELAWDIARQGRWGEAEAAYRDILQARRRLLHRNHPDLYTTLHELAWVLSASDQRQGALRLFEEALGARRAILGSDDPQTLATVRAIECLRAEKDVPVPTHIA